MPKQNEYISPSNRWQAFLGALPFLIFGVASITGKVNYFYNIRGLDVEIVFYIVVLSGFLVGWIRRFPLWSYGFLGWSLMLAWLNTNSSLFGVDLGYRIWIPFGIAVLIALVWTRSLDAITKLFRDIWNDWTRLTFVMYAIGAFVSLIYDENHHPYLLLLMAISTLILVAGAWFFLRSTTLIGRILSIGAGFIAALVPMAISYLTWNWRAYYGLPPSISWYDNLGLAPIGVLFWLLILFWPALIALLHFIKPRTHEIHPKSS